jgi:hypothetical protein
LTHKIDHLHKGCSAIQSHSERTRLAWAFGHESCTTAPGYNEALDFMVFAFPKHPADGAYFDAQLKAMDVGTTGKTPDPKPKHGGLDTMAKR